MNTKEFWLISQALLTVPEVLAWCKYRWPTLSDTSVLHIPETTHVSDEE